MVWVLQGATNAKWVEHAKVPALYAAGRSLHYVGLRLLLNPYYCTLTTTPLNLHP